jgi:hypothetical protein
MDILGYRQLVDSMKPSREVPVVGQVVEPEEELNYFAEAADIC